MIAHGKKIDVVVAGAGGAGLAAALTLFEGRASVIIFEKMEQAGGSTRFVEGMFAAESEIQRKRNIKITKDRAFRDIMEYSHWRANASLVRAFVNKSASTIDWLEQMGVEFTEPSSFWPGAPRTWHLFKGFGASMIKVFLSHVAKKNVWIQYRTAVKELVREGSGPVTGVIVEDEEGKRTKIETGAVIIATGGYANDKELLKQYTGLDLRKNIFSIHNSEKYGEGIRMAWAAGAAEEGMGVLNFSFGGPVGPGIKASGNISASVRQPELWVNQDGVRFCDESIVQNCIYTGNAQARQKGGYVFRVFDEHTKRYFMEEGIDIGVGMLFVPPRTRLTHFDKEVENAVAKGNRNVFVAHTIDELTGMMGIDGRIFSKTVEQYNSFCEKGHDDQFAKDPCYLRPVKVPKFYGFKCYMDFTGTNGGIKINEHTEVLDRQDNVIPGLYAVGNDAGGLYGDSYDMISAGASVGFAINSGRMAGERALKYLRE